MKREVKMSQRRESAVVVCPWILRAARTLYTPHPPLPPAVAVAVAVMPYWAYRLCERKIGVRDSGGWFAGRQGAWGQGRTRA